MLENLLFGVLGCALLILAAAVLFDFGELIKLNDAKEDRRFKSGYKNNIQPETAFREPPSWSAKFLWAAIILFFAYLCFDKELRSEWPVIWRGIVCVCVSLLTWRIYPLFYSRYKRGSTSPIRFFWLRIVISIVFGALITPFLLGAIFPMNSSRLEKTSNLPTGANLTSVPVKELPESKDVSISKTSFTAVTSPEASMTISPTIVVDHSATMPPPLGFNASENESTSSTASVTQVAEQTATIVIGQPEKSR